LPLTSSSVYLNGKFVGFAENGDRLSKELREKRRAAEIDAEANVSYYSKTNEVFVNTDEGRARRPLIIVKNGKPLLKEEHLEKIKKGELHWIDLVQQGIVEYLDAEEEENCFVAVDEDLLKKKVEKGKGERYTHVEIDPNTILGYASSQIPFPEYNMAPRVLMAAQHAKQSLGLYASNYNLRTDTRGYVLHYAQAPLVQTNAYKTLENYKRASGQNFVVAVLSYKGFNMDGTSVDATFRNKTVTINNFEGILQLKDSTMNLQGVASNVESSILKFPK